MTPRERRERAQRSARRGPIYEGIGFLLILVVATLIAGPAGTLAILIFGGVALILGLAVGLVRGPVKVKETPNNLPKARTDRG